MASIAVSSLFGTVGKRYSKWMGTGDILESKDGLEFLEDEYSYP
jgi:Na+/citrate or Na+/malate symporter